jgi:hypothetical protein
MLMAVTLKAIGSQRLSCFLFCIPQAAAICCGVVLVVLLMGIVLINTGMAEERGSISGTVQLNGQGISEHRLMLIRFGPGGDVQRTPGQTDTTGQFIFGNLETGEAFEYFVGIRYEGQLYRSAPIRLMTGQHRTRVVVELGTPATEEAVNLPSFLIANHLVVLVSRDDHLEVREVVRVLSNQTQPRPKASTESSPSKNFLLLPLPQGYFNFVGMQGLNPEHVRLLPVGLHYVAPIGEGEHRFVYTYSLPLHTNLATIVSERTLPTTVLDVLVEDNQLVASSDLQFMGRVSIEPHTFWHFQGANLAVHTRSWLQVTRRNASAPFLQAGTYCIIVGIILSGIGLPLYRTWRWRTQQRQGVDGLSEELADLHVSRLRLLQTIAHLDDQYYAGIIEPSVYQQHRSEYKKQLLDIVRQLRHAPSDKETSGELR